MTDIFSKLQCSHQEKWTLWETTVPKLLHLSQGVRQEGYLWMEDTLTEDTHPFLRACITYIIETCPEPEVFREYAHIWLRLSQAEGARLLEMVLIADAMEQLVRGNHYKDTLLRLGAWFGEDFVPLISEKYQTL